MVLNLKPHRCDPIPSWFVLLTIIGEDSMEVTGFPAPMGDISALQRFCKESKRHNMVTKDFS